MAIRGSCLCGAVTFEIDRACGPVEYCHCNRCRKMSGSSALLAGLFDEDFGIRPDKHIFVDFMPPWDDLNKELPAYTRREIYELRAGRSLPPISTETN